MKKLLLIAFALLLPSVANAGDKFHLTFYNYTKSEISFRYDGGKCWHKGTLPTTYTKIPANGNSEVYHAEHDKFSNIKCIDDKNDLKIEYSIGGTRHSCSFTADGWSLEKVCKFQVDGQKYKVFPKLYERNNNYVDIKFEYD